ncbi:MAG: modulator protein [Pelagibacteraceae bacterium]|nr:modulator protein [Pelagibacteraceae bacterium]PPR10078.1 MAG: Metalloprotease PmbA [Alphaproteobacteria bacterium MarineAlpha11_Bin1]|tara:strand:- start:9356 stop:10699 length:1344 start_codon:yes stop_codon:yes gene_type:complete
MAESYDQLSLLSNLMDDALKQGADAADAVVFNASSVSVSCRLGKLEKLERSESNDLGLRVFVGRQQAIVSSTDFEEGAIKDVVARAVAMAKAAPEDPYCGIATADSLVTDPPTLQIYDAKEPRDESLIEAACSAEDAARSVAGITNTEGAETAWSKARIAIATSNGFARSYETSSHSLAASVLAGEGTSMERDYDYTSSVYHADLADPVEIGRNAGKRAVKRLNARKVETQQVPVIYDPRVSGGIVRHYAGAINGSSISRGTSFLRDEMGKKVLADGINIVDDPHRDRGLRSKPFDAEGLANSKKYLAKDGVLETWVLDLASARQLGIESTGNASRGTASPPSPGVTNLYMEAGRYSPADLISDIIRGFYVTELIGMGINMVTGDYSRGASGFWIENGEITYPVTEMTVAGNLKDMFKKLIPADDLAFRDGTDAPTLRIDGMTVAGN